MAQSSIFPIFLRAEYREDANGIPQFISRIQQAAKISEAELGRVGNALNKALSSPRTGSGSLDLGTAQLREQIKAQEQAAVAAREVQQALLAVANATGTFNGALTPTINAYRDLAKAKEADAASSRAQLATLQAVEAELEKGTRAVQARLAAEQGLANFRKTVNLNEGALRVARGEAAVDRAALSGATLDSVLGRTRASNPDVARQRAQEAAESEKVAAAARQQAAAMAELAQAEASAATGSRLLQAIYRGTALELNNTGTEFKRTANSARESAAAFQEAFAAQERAAEQAAAAVREQAAALAALRAQINPAAAAQEEFNRKVAFAQGALDRGELSQQEYAQAVRLASAALREAGQAEVAAAAARNGFTAATKQGTTARQNVINSVRSERTAFIQLGQQLQDVAVQAQLGTNAFIIFGQQVPQAAFALSGLADSANKTQARIGQIATFLSGPWGAAIFVAIAALGPLVQKLFEASDASGTAARSVEELVAEKVKAAAEARNAAIAEDAFARTLEGVADAARRNREAIERLTVAKRTDSEETLRNSRIQLANALALQFNTQQQIFNAKALLDAQLARASGPGQGNELAALGLQRRQEALDGFLAEFAKGAGEIVAIQKSINDASVLVAVERGVAGEEGQIKRRYEAEIEGLKRSAQARGLSNEQIEREAAAIKAREEAELDGLRQSVRSNRGRGERVNREPKQLADFGKEAAEQIKRINERFDEQPRLVDAAAQATRQLDEIMADLEKRKPANFEQMIQDAESAKRTIKEALVRPFEQLRAESENRVAIERALAAGRVDEAAALQEIFRLEQQRRALTEAEKQDVADIVRLERQRIEALRDQQALFQAQLDVVQTVRRDLTDILSGRSTDFFKNFRQALQDLQGQRLFEDLFGKAFRDIEEQLRGNTPQGRANAAYTREVNKTAETTGRLEAAVSSLADTLTAENDRITRNAFPGYGFGAAANDNIISSSAGARGSVVQNLLRELGIGTGITVTGGINPDAPFDISRRSTKEIADAISRSTVEGFLSPLRDILGEKFFNGLAGVLGDVLSAYVRGGEAGAVFEGLSRAANAFGAKGLGAAFSQASLGAEVGTQVAGISKALGLGGSTTGAQIGGALGSFAGPIGTVVGAIAGNIIGGLVKATKRGSATIGNLGGELAIVGTRGNSRSRIEQSTGLAGSALDAIDNIAQQLGANVDAARGSVSIGVRNNNIRVDTSGRGITKTSRGAIDFGEDAEAAVRAAVLDLIQDGVITGLRQSEQRLLQAGDDIEAALRDVLTFRSVFDRLQELKDPLGFAITQLNREFEQLIDLFERAGASSEEFAQLEELYNLQRAQAIEDATDRVVGSLRQLLNELTIGDSGLSLRSRRSNALGQFNDLAARVAAGDASAFDDFADISQQLLDIERQLFGSTQSYFDRLAQITALTEQAIADQTNVTSIGAASPSPFDERASVTRAVEAASSEQVSWLRAINDNLIALNPALRTGTTNVSGGGRSTGPFPTTIQNF